MKIIPLNETDEILLENYDTEIQQTHDLRVSIMEQLKMVAEREKDNHKEFWAKVKENHPEIKDGKSATLARKRKVILIREYPLEKDEEED